jgi:dihydrofolate synthase / folylpolyglutamate synthase
MTYAEALAWLHSLIDFERLGATYFGRDRFQLAGTRRLLTRLGDPQGRLHIVHIAGTKGKGSTATMLDAILRAHGRSVGLFTQPHLTDIRERTRVNGRMISPADFAEAVAQVRPLVAEVNDTPGNEPITFYEAHLALSVWHFARAGIEFAIMETGLGGRLDATNALEPVACAITRIDFDHTDILGDRIEGIAREKAGILKPGVPCVFQPQRPEVQQVLEAQAAAVGAPLVPFPRIVSVSDEEGPFTIEASRTYEGLSLPLTGKHQRENAAAAIALAEMLGPHGVDVSVDGVRAALTSLNWPGRFQVVEGRPTVVLDVAHNAVSAQALRDGLEHLLRSRPRGTGLVLVVGMARDKDIDAFAATLFPLAARVVCTRAESPRAASPERIFEAASALGAKGESVPTVAGALARARELAGPGGVVCVTGSFHVVGEAMVAMGIQPC